MLLKTKDTPLRIAILSGLFLFIILAVFTKDDITLSGNESSRFATVQSLVENGTFSIDNSMFRTEDRVLINGHFYSDKPPLLCIFLASIYWIMHNVFQLSFAANYHLCVFILNLACGAVFSVMLFYLFLFQLKNHDVSPGLKIMLSAALILCTWIFSFGVTVNNHTPAACVFFIFFCFMNRIAANGRTRDFFWAALFSGILFNLDMPAGFFSAIACISMVFLLPLQARALRMSAFLSGFFIPVLLMVFMNFKAYGSAVPAYMVPGAYEFQGNIHSSGMAGLHRPADVFEYFLNILTGQRGLFLYMPALLFIFPALWGERKKMNAETIIVLISIIVIIAFYGVFTGDYGGWSYGFRFLIPVIPVLWYYVSVWIMDNYKSKLLMGTLYVLLMSGLFTSWVGAYNPWPVCFEGAATREGSIEEKIRFPLSANLLCMSYENSPASALTNFIIEKIYGRELAEKYLVKSFLNMKKPDMLKKGK